MIKLQMGVVCVPEAILEKLEPMELTEVLIW